MKRQRESLEDLVVKWNGGVRVGAITRFAEFHKVQQPTVSRWVSLLQPPNEVIRKNVAKSLGISVEELMSYYPQADERITARSLSQEVQELRERCAAVEEKLGELTEMIQRFLESQRSAMAK